jgi:type I restriction enzyme S subunit
MATEWVRPGYKQTEVCVIPEDWTVLSIREITKKGSDAIRIGPFGSQLKKTLLVKSGYKVYGQENVFEKKMDLGDRYIDKAHFNRLKSCELVSGDFVVSMMGTVGKCMIVPNNFEQGIMDSHLLRLRLDDKIIKKELLLQLFNSGMVLGQIAKLSVGGIMEGLSSSIIKKIQIPLPREIEEQSAIAIALSETDELIETLHKLIEKKKNIKQGASQELLTGKKRLHGFRGKWVTKQISSIGSFRAGNGFPLSCQGETEGKYPFYKVSDMNNEGNDILMINSNNYISEATAKKIDAHIFTKNVIVFAKIGAAIFLERKRILSKNSCIDNNMMGLIVDESEADYLFVYYVLTQIKLGQLSSTTALPSLGGKDIGELSISLPSEKEEQTAIARVLTDMDSEIKAIEQQRNKYKQLKIGMMQQLLTGRIRLKWDS